jgi:hypothetical protein
MDTTEARKQIARQFDEIDKTYGDKDDYAIGAVIAIVEVVGGGQSELRVNTSLGGQPNRLVGYLELAKARTLAEQLGLTPSAGQASS